MYSFYSPSHSTMDLCNIISDIRKRERHKNLNRTVNNLKLNHHNSYAELIRCLYRISRKLCCKHHILKQITLGKNFVFKF